MQIIISLGQQGNQKNNHFIKSAGEPAKKRSFLESDVPIRFANRGIMCPNDGISFEDIPLLECMYRLFTRIPGESYRKRLRSLLLGLSDVLRSLINSLCVDCARALWASFSFRF